MVIKPARDFYAQDTLVVAQALIGMRLLHRVGGETRIGRIVETEAYQGPEDRAAHSARGRTPRNAVMFGAPGHAYVYLIYGIWHCVNVVTRDAGIPHAVLVRAVEPLQHIEAKTQGPGLLCRAMGIDLAVNGIDLLGDRLWLEAETQAPTSVINSSPRIGVDYAGEWAERAWRFYDAHSAHVSRLTPAQRRLLSAAVR